MKMATMKSGLGALALLPGLAMAAPAVADKADNAFMMICTALVLFMTIPGIALFYGGLIRGKNVLSMLTQVIVTFGLVCVLWVIYGYIAINHPQYADQAKGDNHLSQHGQNVLTADQAAVKQRNPRDSHKQNQRGANHHKRVIGFVRHRRRGHRQPRQKG